MLLLMFTQWQCCPVCCTFADKLKGNIKLKKQLDWNTRGGGRQIIPLLSLKKILLFMLVDFKPNFESFNYLQGINKV